MTIQNISQGVYSTIPLQDLIAGIDSIIFDCDGVLIDVTNSYDLAIILTVDYVLKEIANITQFDKATPQMIDGFKDTGGFNDEVDVTYSIIISLVAAKKLGKSGSEFVFQVISNANQTGISSVEKYLASLPVDVSKIKSKLNYPGDHSTNTLYSIFDQLFYGPELYYKLYKKKSSFSESGLIKNDKVILKKELLEKLVKKFDNKIAIVSGRGKSSVSYSLGELLTKFNLENSIFLEDMPRKFAKPNPDPLIDVISKLGSKHCLYVGDSMEDIIMAQMATKNGHKTTFCGIFGTNRNPESKKMFFEEKQVPLILESIELIPKVLNLD